MASNCQRPTSFHLNLWEEKLKIDGCELDDPFAIDGEQWSKDLTKWQELEFGDLYTYLIKSKEVYTK